MVRLMTKFWTSALFVEIFLSGVPAMSVDAFPQVAKP